MGGVFLSRDGLYCIRKKLFTKKEALPLNKPKEGEIFKTVSIGGATFTIKYGYYEDYEREQGEPIPIYPDLKKEPTYADDGRLIVTQMQDTCKYSNVKTKDSFCVECKHFRYGDDLIGFCNHSKNKKK